MNLKKTNEKWDRSFDADGNATEKLESVQFNIIDSDGNTVGNAGVYQGSASASLNIYGFGSVEEGTEKLKEALGISD